MKEFCRRLRTYPVGAEVYTLDALPELLVEHRLVVATSSARQKGTINEGCFGMGWSPGEVGATGICHRPFDASTSNHWSGPTLHQNQRWDPGFDAIPSRQPRLEGKSSVNNADVWMYNRNFRLFYNYRPKTGSSKILLTTKQNGN